MGLILGGALGNMIDRVTRGLVIDFLDFDFPNIKIRPLGIYMTRWPTFNLADSSVLIGIVILLIIIIVEAAREGRLTADEN
jgi:signal peptidase II